MMPSQRQLLAVDIDRALDKATRQPGWVQERVLDALIAIETARLLLVDVNEALEQVLLLPQTMQDGALDALSALERVRRPMVERHRDGFTPSERQKALNLEKAGRKSWEEYRRTADDASRGLQPDYTFERRVACFEMIRQARGR